MTPPRESPALALDLDDYRFLKHGHHPPALGRTRLYHTPKPLSSWPRCWYLRVRQLVQRRQRLPWDTHTQQVFYRNQRLAWQAHFRGQVLHAIVSRVEVGTLQDKDRFFHDGILYQKIYTTSLCVEDAYGMVVGDGFLQQFRATTRVSRLVSPPPADEGPLRDEHL